jgi:hypothetical protein
MKDTPMNKLSLLSITVFFAGTLSAMESAVGLVPQSPRTKFLLEELRLGNAGIMQRLPKQELFSHVIEESAERSLKEQVYVTTQKSVAAWCNAHLAGFPVPTEAEFQLQEEQLLELVNGSEENKTYIMNAATKEKQNLLSDDTVILAHISRPECKAATQQLALTLFPKLKRENRIAHAKLAQCNATGKQLEGAAVDEVWKPYRKCLTKITACLYAIQAAGK